MLWHDSKSRWACRSLRNIIIYTAFSTAQWPNSWRLCWWCFPKQLIINKLYLIDSNGNFRDFTMQITAPGWKKPQKKTIRSLGSKTIATLTATLRPCLTCTKLKCTVNTHHFQLAILHRLPSAAARSATAGHLVAVPNVQVQFEPKLGTAGGFKTNPQRSHIETCIYLSNLI